MGERYKLAPYYRLVYGNQIHSTILYPAAKLRIDCDLILSRLHA